MSDCRFTFIDWLHKSKLAENNARYPAFHAAKSIELEQTVYAYRWAASSGDRAINSILLCERDLVLRVVYAVDH